MKAFIKNIFGLLIVFFSVFFFRTAIADWNYVPSGSMQPNLYDGDVVLVSKMAYGPTIPLVNIPLFKTGEPSRGDVITFIPPHEERLYVKRVVGVPGDRIAILGQDVYVNGGQIPYERLRSDAALEIGREQLGATSYQVQHSHGGGFPMLNLDFVVPESSYFVLGDHRTNSADSRLWGFVERKNIMGKVTHIALSVSARRKLLSRVAVPIEQ